MRTDRLAVVEDLVAEVGEKRAVTLGEVVPDPQHPILQHVHRDPRFDPWTHASRIAHYVRELQSDGRFDLEGPGMGD